MGSLVFEKLCEDVRKNGLTDDQILRLSKIFGNRFDNAYKMLKERRVKRYCFRPSGRVVWVVVGKERDYHVIPEANFCSCDDFYFRVIDYEVYLCYHLIAQKLADALGEYKEIEASDQIYDKLMEEWRTVRVVKKALPITEIKNIREASNIALSEERGMTVHQLVTKLNALGFDILTPRHLAVILATDPERRFSCKDGVWGLR